MKDLPVGTKVQYENVQLVVTATKDNQPVCTGCYFSDGVRWKHGKAKFSCYVHGMSCTKFMRKDKRYVIFKEIGL